MMDILCSSRLNYLDGYLFFQTEQEKVFGKICAESGQVRFFSDVPEKFIKNRIWAEIMQVHSGKLYVICNGGMEVYEMSSDGCFSQMKCRNEAKYIDTWAVWAGSMTFENKIYAFRREDGAVLEIDTSDKSFRYVDTEIKDKLLWTYRQRNSAYIISWDCKRIYQYDPRTGRTDVAETGFCEDIELESKTPIPLHGMCSDNDALYFHDANKILKYDITSKKTTVLCETGHGDNGRRIILLDSLIVVPTLNQRQFYIIEKDSGKVWEKRNITADAVSMGRIGVPCYSPKAVYLSIINSNMLLKIDKQTAEFEWIRLDFDRESLKRLMGRTVRENEIVTESSVYPVAAFLDNLLKP